MEGPGHPLRADRLTASPELGPAPCIQAHSLGSTILRRATTHRLATRATCGRTPQGHPLACISLTSADAAIMASRPTRCNGYRCGLYRDGASGAHACLYLAVCAAPRPRRSRRRDDALRAILGPTGGPTAARPPSQARCRPCPGRVRTGHPGAHRGRQGPNAKNVSSGETAESPTKSRTKRLAGVARPGPIENKT